MPVPVFDPANFVTGEPIDNPYLPLIPGTTRIYQGEIDGELEVDRFMVTNKTVVIMGVTCVEVKDVSIVDGVVTESTLDWFAQDKAGNVWYFGEASKAFLEDGTVSTEGSWKAGKDGALPGIVMLANPQVGVTYHQENAPGVAEDQATVVSLSADANVDYGSFHSLIKTREINLDGDVEYKFYAAGIGEIRTVEEGGSLELTKIKIEDLTGKNMLTGFIGPDDLLGYAGNDTLHGLGGADSLYGHAGNDRLFGDNGKDWLQGGPGNDYIDGGDGQDTAAYSGNLSRYHVYEDAQGHIHVVDSLANGDGSDIVSNVEQFVFHGVAYNADFFG